jgi:hypothetical protein
MAGRSGHRGRRVTPSQTIGKQESALFRHSRARFRWPKLIETGAFATVEELAAAEKINPSYVRRVLRLTLLASEVVEAILDGRNPAGVTLAVLMRPFGRVGGAGNGVWFVRHTEVD